MGLIRFIQDHNRNKELKNLRILKEKELEKEETNNVNYQDRNCTSCGRSIPEDARFCPYCGKKYW